jgi:hypothetical protein
LRELSFHVAENTELVVSPDATSGKAKKHDEMRVEMCVTHNKEASLGTLKGRKIEPA